MLKDLTLSEYIHQHCNESMEHALLAERHPLWARSCPELNDIDFIRLGFLRCLSVVKMATTIHHTDTAQKS